MKGVSKRIAIGDNNIDSQSKFGNWNNVKEYEWGLNVTMLKNGVHQLLVELQMIFLIFNFMNLYENKNTRR